MSRTRVAHVIDSLADSGGAERRLVEEVLALGDRFDQLVVRCYERAELEPRLVAGGVEVRALGLTARRAARTFPFAARRLRSVLRAWRPDVVHTSLFNGNLVGQLAARPLGIPVVSEFGRRRRRPPAGAAARRVVVARTGGPRRRPVGEPVRERLLPRSGRRRRGDQRRALPRPVERRHRGASRHRGGGGGTAHSRRARAPGGTPRRQRRPAGGREGAGAPRRGVPARPGGAAAGQLIVAGATGPAVTDVRAAVRGTGSARRSTCWATAATPSR